MTDTAAAQLRRILSLIPLCQEDTSHALEDMAITLGTDARTLLRDLRTISERYDVSGAFPDELQVFVEPGRFSLRSAHFRRPMRITLRELGALNLGLAILEAERSPEEQTAIQRARSRLAQAMAGSREEEDEVGGLLHAEQGADADPEILRILRQGVQLDRCVTIRYQGAQAAEASERVVCPLALLPSRGRWFLVGAVDDQVRVYRLDRMESAGLSPLTFDRSLAPSVEELLSGERIFVGEVDESVTVWYGPAVARWIAEREAVQVEADGSVTVEYPLGDPEWAVRHVLQYGPDAEVVAPESVRAMVVERLRGMVGSEQ